MQMTTSRVKTARKSAEEVVVQHICALLTKAVDTDGGLSKAMEVAQQIVDSYYQQLPNTFSSALGTHEDTMRFAIAGLLEREILMPLERELRG
jgi:hypothetical protein